MVSESHRIGHRWVKHSPIKCIEVLLLGRSRRDPTTYPPILERHRSDAVTREQVRFRTQAALGMHMATFIEDGSLECPKVTSSNCDNDKPQKCPVCGQGYESESLVVAHSAKCVLFLWKDNLFCQFCVKTFKVAYILHVGKT